MEITFEQEYLRDMDLTGKAHDKKHRFQPEIIRKHYKVIDLMIAQTDTSDLRKYTGLNHEPLKGDKADLSFARRNDKYFTFCLRQVSTFITRKRPLGRGWLWDVV